MNEPKKPLKPPTVLELLIGSAIPLVVAIAVASVAALLVYLFWFGFDGLSERLFR